MLLVNPQQIIEEAQRLSAASDVLLRAYDTLTGIITVMETQKPIDTAAANLNAARSAVEKHLGSVSRLTRALEQIGSTYGSCERTIENNCSSAIRKNRVDALIRYAVGSFPSGLD